jgi:tellurite resistance protein TerB
MSMLNWIDQKSKELVNSVKQYLNHDFLDAIVASCALVSISDGKIDSAEKIKMLGFIQSNETLKVYDHQKIEERFSYYINRLEFDYNIGMGECLLAIGKVRKNVDQAQLLVRVACTIGASDGNFDVSERQVVTNICKHLGLNPSEFDL